VRFVAAGIQFAAAVMRVPSVRDRGGVEPRLGVVVLFVSLEHDACADGVPTQLASRPGSVRPLGAERIRIEITHRIKAVHGRADDRRQKNPARAAGT